MQMADGRKKLVPTSRKAGPSADSAQAESSSDAPAGPASVFPIPTTSSFGPTGSGPIFSMPTASSSGDPAAQTPAFSFPGAQPWTAAAPDVNSKFEIDLLKRDLEAAKKSRDDLEARVANLETEKADYANPYAKLDQLKKQVADLEAEKADYTKYFEAYCAIYSFEVSKMQEQSVFHRTLRDKDNDLRDKDNEIKGLRASLEKQGVGYKAQEDKLRAACVTAEDATRDAVKKLLESHRANEELKKKHATEVKRLEDDLAERDNRIKEDDDRIGTLKNSLETAKTTSNEANEALEESTRAHSRQSDALQYSSNQLHTLQEKYDKLVIDHATASNRLELLSTIEDDYNALKPQFDELSTELDELHNQQAEHHEARLEEEATSHNLADELEGQRPLSLAEYSDSEAGPQSSKPVYIDSGVQTDPIEPNTVDADTQTDPIPPPTPVVVQGPPEIVHTPGPIRTVVTKSPFYGLFKFLSFWMLVLLLLCYGAYVKVLEERGEWLAANDLAATRLVVMRDGGGRGGLPTLW
ncbi:MAG: hypothetical protein M1820_003056 [Bogoriella megaspora]|nr:MAG: hypothetical protein M1820_003056 [Bogoriella megaspora]